MKTKIIALFGKSGAGKNFVLDCLTTRYDLNRIVSCTTRPKRDNEIDGVDYYFISKSDFIDKCIKDEILEYSSYNGWFYGTLATTLSRNKINIGIFNLVGLRYLMYQEFTFDVLPVYIEAPDKERLLRLLNRGEKIDCYEVCRRFIADGEDFQNLTFPHVTYNNIYKDVYIDDIPEIYNFIKGVGQF